MSPERRRKGKTLRRRPIPYPERERILIYTEGRITEPMYFGPLRREFRGSGRMVEFGPAHGEPLKVVKEAAEHQTRERRHGVPFDQVWCVIDVECPRPHDSLDEALSLARRKNVRCAISNPCFELWLILHFTNCFSYLTTEDACRKLEGLDCGYSRNNKRFRYDDLRKQRTIAAQRARQLDARVDPASPVRDRNPWTSVWELVEELTR